MRSFWFKNGFCLLCCTLALFALSYIPMCHAQDTSNMVGTVTDQSGAAVPGATVTLSNSTNGQKFTETTNSIGFYRFANVPPGTGYEVTFSAKGFNPLQVKDIYLTVGTVRTQNASLAVGAHQEVVEVSASNAEVTIDTTSATIGNTFDVQQLNALPVENRSDPTALFSMQPGVTDLGAVTGARVDQNYVTLDGMDVNDFATGGASQSNSGPGVTEGFGTDTIVGHAPVDSVEEFHGTVGGNQADTGPASGGQFQLVTKSGSNQFHGNVNEYHRDPDLVANSWFNNNASPIVPRNHLIQNQFGGAVGGPILHDRLFFFGDYNENRVISFLSQTRIVPTSQVRNGQIGYTTASGGTCYLNATTSSVCTADGSTQPSVNSFDPAGIGESANWLQALDARFPTPNSTAVGDGINTTGYIFNAPNNDDETNYVARFDYNLTQTQKLFARLSMVRENAVETPNQFPADGTAVAPVVDRSFGFVVGHTWVIGSTRTNRIYAGETVQSLNFPITSDPDGSTFFTFGDGANSAPVNSSLYVQPAESGRRIPVMQISDDFTWTRGSHTLQMGGTFKDILAHDYTRADYNTTEIGMGGLNYTLCGPGTGACVAGSNTSLRPSDIASSSAPTWDQTFTTLLARIGNVQSDYNYNAQGTALAQLSGDTRYYRYYQTQGYVQDAWRLMPNLTITYGLTYQWFTVPYEEHGLESVEPFTFDEYMQARIQQSNNSQTGPDAVPLIAYSLGGKGNGPGAPGMYGPEYRNLAPHVGFSWNPSFDRKMVINGSAAITYDRNVINSIQALQDRYSYLFQQEITTSEGVSGEPYQALATGPRLSSSNTISTVPIAPPATPKSGYYPFATTSYCNQLGDPTPCGLLDGYAFNETIDPSLRTPYNFIFNFGIQRTLPKDMIFKVSYAAHFGRRLLAQADANQVLEFPDPQSGELYSTAFGNITKEARAGVPYTSVKPEPWFEDVLDPNLGASYGYANNTQYFLAKYNPGFVWNGDFGDFTQAMASTYDNTTGALATPFNVGMGSQFSENSFHNNKGFSNYDGLLFTLQKNLSHGIHFDFNYTWSHSIDNISFFANSQGDTGIGGGGLICDDVRPRECRASSDFDVRQIVSADALYELPFGEGKMFLNNGSLLTKELFGGWSVSGILDRHTGYPWQTSANAYVASYSNDAPGILTGNASLARTGLVKLAGGGVNDFANATPALGASVAAAQFSGPVGFTIGPRNSERGPGFFNMDLGLGKKFPLSAERFNFIFRADAFNALNHPNFAVPSENVYNGLDETDYQEGPGFGQISYPEVAPGNGNNGARVLQVSGRIEF
jgi:hypothetical protein